MLVICVIFTIIASKEFIRYNEDGEAELSPERKEKLARELDELEEAEQYVLLARFDKMYPCFNCKEKSSIFLTKGLVWKYGVTIKREKGRYGNKLFQEGFIYLVQYKGLLHQCFQKEKLKIYNYAILPENLIRPIPLIRPPGNKQDN